MLFRTALVFLASVLLTTYTVGARAAEKRRGQDERLGRVTSIFVAGNNQAAEGARHTLGNGKTCFVLATKAADADAVLDVTAEAETMGGSLGQFGGRNWVASGTLTLKSGDLIWTHSERFGDSPLRSGGKTAGDLLVRHLAQAAACKARGK